MLICSLLNEDLLNLLALQPTWKYGKINMFFAINGSVSYYCNIPNEKKEIC